MLSVENLNVFFRGTDGRELAAVRDVSFSLQAGEVLGLVGESGSGKSVTSLAIMRLLPPQARIEGSIFFQGEFQNDELPHKGFAKQNLLQICNEDMRRLRGTEISMIFQEPMTALNPVMRVGDQIAEAVLAHAKVSKKQAYGQAVEALHDVAINDAERRARDFPHQLSGGMRQRVMIAMAIVNHPRLLIADEPTTALDVTVQAQVLELLAELRRKFELAMLFISHDLAVVANVADRVAVMYGGSIVEMGRAEAIFRRAIHPYTVGLLHAVPTLHSKRDQPLETIEGTVPSHQSFPPGCTFEPRCEIRVPECQTKLPPLLEAEPGHWARCPVKNQYSVLGTQYSVKS
jgi:oligopeptide/dipeptide ABC transporter ATP-binding protein